MSQLLFFLLGAHLADGLALGSVRPHRRSVPPSNLPNNTLLIHNCTIPASNASYVETIPHILHQKPYISNQSQEQSKFSDGWLQGGMKDWERKFWNEESLKEFIAIEEPEFVKTWVNFSSEVARFDSARYAYLKKFGGVYADMDIEVLKDPTPLFATGHDLVFFQDQHGLISNALIASVPNHPFWEYLLHELSKPEHARARLPVDMAGCPALTEILAKYFIENPERIKTTALIRGRFWAPAPMVNWKAPWLSARKERRRGAKLAAVYPDAFLFHHHVSDWRLVWGSELPLAQKQLSSDHWPQREWFKCSGDGDN